ncbi:hypothetical protein FACS189491_06210 [Spirochaetia bacterium]|nr:hypothetical protein FACS189491_06210 [Spirochaetia bacterium]
MSREALADYAAAIDPDKRRSADGGHEDGGGFGAGDNHGDSNMAGGDGGSNAGNGAGGSPNKDRDKDPWDGKSLRNKILRAEGQNPLLSLMNRLPGKKGRQWMVFPFVFEDQGRAFAATLRVLLTPEGSIMGESPAGASGFRAERMALEIAGEAQRWLFIADNPPGGRLRLTGSLWPGISGSEKMTAKALQSWEKELAGLLGSIPEQVRIQNAGEFSPFAPDSRDETLLSVNEEV